MPERSTLTELCQIGIETVLGTAVAATKTLQAASIKLDLEVDTDEFQPRGFKYPTIVTPTKDWTGGSLDGRLTYDEFLYLLALGVATPTVVTAAGVSTWTCAPSTSAPDTMKSATVENGSSVRAHRAPGLQLSDLSYSIDRDSGLSIAGTPMGMQLQDGVTLSAGATASNPTPILIGQVSVFMDTTSAGLGTTKLLRLHDLEWKLSSRQGPVWTLDAAQTSYAAPVETDPTCELMLTLEANSEGMGPLALLRAGSTRFIRVEAIGATISGGSTYRFRHDMAVKVKDPGSFGDTDGLVAMPWTFDVVHDAGWTKAQVFELVNAMPAL